MILHQRGLIVITLSQVVMASDRLRVIIRIVPPSLFHIYIYAILSMIKNRTIANQIHIKLFIMVLSLILIIHLPHLINRRI